MISVKTRMYLESLLNNPNIDLDEYFAEWQPTVNTTVYSCKSCEYCKHDLELWTRQRQAIKENPYDTHSVVSFRYPLICINPARNAQGNLSRALYGCTEYVRAIGSDDWEVAA